MSEGGCQGAGCYVAERRLTCQRCRGVIEVGAPVHSFVDLLNPGAALNYHCACLKRAK